MTRLKGRYIKKLVFKRPALNARELEHYLLASR